MLLYEGMSCDYVCITYVVAVAIYSIDKVTGLLCLHCIVVVLFAFHAIHTDKPST